ncbi:Hypp7629 [Branchiostoma lanceolatum]|uniref:Hypp7629 protein n=1 Tax=Branchiostoma lanceolatum TaxID=7740 RepID=A0A8K0EEX8_BRALA|nr:Hypp7629 [Branchiostoma lanceolatum]
MVMRLPLKGKTQLTLISAYAPTMSYEQEQKELFYEKLAHLLNSVSKHDKLLLMGDFNARVGSDSQSWPDVIGAHGVGRKNSNGQMLLTLCSEHGLTVTNTLYQLPDIHKVTWMHPRSKRWHQIDYIITRRQDIRDVRITRAIRGADCWTDHTLLRSKLSFSTASAHHTHRRRKDSTKKKLDVLKLSHPETKEVLAANLREQIKKLPAENNPEKAWKNFRKLLYGTSELTLGHARRKHQDWFDNNNEEITRLLSQNQEAFTTWLNDKNSTAKHDHLKHLRSKVQTELRRMKDKWWESKATELQQYADEHNTRKFFAGLKAVYGPSSNAMAPVRSADGTLLTEKGDITERRRQHFSQLLNRPSNIDQQAIQDMPQRPLMTFLDDPSSLEETQKAIKQLQGGKAPGPDGIPSEILKEGGEAVTAKLTELLQMFWREGTVP